MRYLLLAFALSALVLGAPASAQSQFDADVMAADQERRTERLTAIGEAIADPATDAAATLPLAEELRGARANARLERDRITEQRARLDEAVGRLGDPPAEGEPAEPPDLAAARSRLAELLAGLDALDRRAALQESWANALLERAGVSRRDQIVAQFQERGPAPLSARVIREAAESFAAGAANARERAASWLEGRAEPSISLAQIAAGVVLAIFLIGPGINAGRAWVGRLANRDETRPDALGLASGARAISSLVLGVVAAGFVAVMAQMSGVFEDDAGRALVLAFVRGILVVAAARAFVDALFAPGRAAAARAVPVRDEGAAALASAGVVLALIYAVNELLRDGGSALGATPELAALQTLVAVLFFVLAAYVATRKRAWTREGERASAPRLRLIVRLLAIAAVAASAVGYSTAAQLLVSRVTLALIALGALATARFVLRAAASRATHGGGPESSADDSAGSGQDGPVTFWLNIAIDITLALAAAPIALLLFGVEPGEIADWGRRALTGVEIGAYTFSAGAIITAIALFAGLLLVTRFLQRALASRVLPQTRLDEGARASMTTLVGYIGLIVAAIAGLGAAGVDFSQLALIAGALSVGIGFGLQAIVNNFVSGLILLFERPIKPGDWVVLPSGEGLVKKISVRSTEIETFDRSTIIVPNSELINSTVVNWTHRNKTGRFAIKIGVAYGTDAELVRDTLLACAQAEQRVLKYPEPHVFFADFGASSLDFELRFYVADASNSLQIRNDMRYTILRVFREKGIQIPFPQHDVHIVTNVGAKPQTEGGA